MRLKACKHKQGRQTDRGSRRVARAGGQRVPAQQKTPAQVSGKQIDSHNKHAARHAATCRHNILREVGIELIILQQRGWEGRHADGGRRVASAPRQPLPQLEISNSEPGTSKSKRRNQHRGDMISYLFRKERHKGAEQTQRKIATGVERVAGAGNVRRRAVAKHGLSLSAI